MTLWWHLKSIWTNCNGDQVEAEGIGQKGPKRSAWFVLSIYSTFHDLQKWYNIDDPQAGHLPTLQCIELQQHYAIHFHCDVRNSFICLHICHRLRDIAHAQVNSCHPMSSYSVTSYCSMSLWYQYHFIFYHIRSYHIMHEDSFHIISTTGC